MTYIPQTDYSWLTLLSLCAFVLAISFITAFNATNYNNVLNDTNDDNIGLSRGNILWLFWLNVTISVIGFLFAIFLLYRIIWKPENVYEKIFKSDWVRQITEAQKRGDFGEVLRLENCKKLGFREENDCETYNSLDYINEKVEYYLEKSRFIEDNIEKTGNFNIRSRIYNNLCAVGEESDKCIEKTLQKIPTSLLYEKGGVKELETAKEATIKVIKERYPDFKEKYEAKEEVINGLGQKVKELKEKIGDTTPENLDENVFIKQLNKEIEEEKSKLKNNYTWAPLNDDEKKNNDKIEAKIENLRTSRAAKKGELVDTYEQYKENLETLKKSVKDRDNELNGYLKWETI